MITSLPPLSQVVRALAVMVVAVAAVPSPALAQCPQTSLADIESEVMCPVCGTPLSLATEAPQAEEQRDFIVRRIERCQSEDEIKAALVAEFGEGVLATPGDDGFDLAAYVLPGVAIVAGAGGIALAALRWRRGRQAGAAVTAGAAGGDRAPPRSRAESERLAADLERYDL